MRASLLRWYRAHRRDLPWRGNRSAYEILVSEIMLQQTRVETVLRYYEPFLNRFPRVEILASAPIDEVLASWSGLGYYRRARHLHAAAVEIIARGSFPRTSRELETLPGIGRYTAAAVASIAFGEPVAVVDGNVERVASRLLALSVDPKTGEGRRAVESQARSLLDESCPGDSNQAMMELGARVCRPRSPRCEECPIDVGCRARDTGDPESFPRGRKRAREVKVRRTVAVVAREDGVVLLTRYPEDSALLAGLWDFPWVDGGQNLAVRAAALGERYGGRWKLGKSLGRLRHGITFRSFDVDTRRASFEADRDAVAERPEVGYFTAAEIRALPSGSMVRKVLGLLGRD